MGDGMITGNTATVNTESGSLNVREEAGKDSKIPGKLEKRTSVEGLEEKDDWKQICSGDLIGWVSSAYLKKDEEAENPKK